ncbi:MAG: glycoside hydrolase family 25, partial [Acetatifactor sp.]|nr:glycoside hydrolase family 25 [Acetatifactor sp.]
MVMVLQRRGSREQDVPEENSGSMMTEASQDALGNGTPGEMGGTEPGRPDESIPAEENDPQEDVPQELGSQVDVAQLLVSDRVQEQQRVTIGIDVSRYQGTIDWSQVAEAGIDFAMIRVGYRSAQEDREIYADTNARYNMQEAQAAGIQVGVYFFSTAATREEAIEEAKWVSEYISQYRITYPVAF